MIKKEGKKYIPRKDIKFLNMSIHNIQYINIMDCNCHCGEITDNIDRKNSL